MRQRSDCIYRIPEPVPPAHSLQDTLCPYVPVPIARIWDLSLSSYFRMLLVHDLTYAWIQADAFPSRVCIFDGPITASISILDDEYYCLLSFAPLYLVSIGPSP